MDSIVIKDVHCCRKNIEIFNKIIYKQINHILRQLGGAPGLSNSRDSDLMIIYRPTAPPF
jgi:hypothetical protein